jgi:hypothetical protein
VRIVGQDMGMSCSASAIEVRSIAKKITAVHEANMFHEVQPFY